MKKSYQNIKEIRNYICIILFFLELYCVIFMAFFFYSYKKDSQSAIFTSNLHLNIVKSYILPYIFPIAIALSVFTLIFAIDRLLLSLSDKLRNDKKSGYYRVRAILSISIQLVWPISLILYIYDQSYRISDLFSEDLLSIEQIGNFSATLTVALFINDRLKLHNLNYLKCLYELFLNSLRK